MIAAQDRETLDGTCFRVTHDQQRLTGFRLPIAGAVKLVQRLEPRVTESIACRCPLAHRRVERASMTWRAGARHSGQDDAGPFCLQAKGLDVMNFEKQI